MISVSTRLKNSISSVTENFRSGRNAARASATKRQRTEEGVCEDRVPKRAVIRRCASYFKAAELVLEELTVLEESK
jgi:hypothetical protein